MRKANRVVLVGVAVATCAATAVIAQPAVALSGCDGSAPSPPFAISGPSVRSTTFNQLTPVQGTAGELQQVKTFYRKAFTATYVEGTPATSGCDGSWSTSYRADDDYRIYATRTIADQNYTTPSVLVQIAPTISGAVNQVVRKGSTYTIRGTGTPTKTLTIHFHKAGTAPTDYSILRTVTVGADGSWQRAYAATVDYRFYATLPNGQKSPTVLVQAR